MSISISISDKSRQKLTKALEKEIRALYSQVSKEIEAEISKLDTSTTSGVLRNKYLKNLQNKINKSLEKVGKSSEALAKESMISAANLIGSDIQKWLSEYGIDIKIDYTHVAEDVVESIISGDLYEGDWSLSKAVWKNVETNQKDIEMIIAKGIAENKSVVDIAKDLAAYVNPHKLIKWNLVAPDGRRILRTSVDYNAQRLVRTMVSHAYQQSFIRATEKNPFVEDYIWVSSNGGRSCPLCKDRNGTHYKKGDLPLDHPNGMCTWVANTVSDSKIIDRLVDWFNGSEDIELDEYAKSLGYNSNQ